MTNQAAVSAEFIVQQIVKKLFPGVAAVNSEAIIEKIDQLNYASTINEAQSNLVQNMADILRCPCTASDYPQILSALHDVIDNSNKKSARIRELEEEIRKNDNYNTNRKNHYKAAVYDEILVAVAPICEGETLLSKVEAMRDRCNVVEESERKGLRRANVFIPNDLRLETADLITSFAENLAQRLVYKQRNGRGGWERDDWREECLAKILTAEKPIDVAAYAVFAWHHDWQPKPIELTQGELVSQPASTVNNHHITVNVGGEDLAKMIANEIAKAKQLSEPVGFRTEPCNCDFHPAGYYNGAHRCMNCHRSLNRTTDTGKGTS